MRKLITAVKGTRDYYPEQMAVRTWLYQIVRGVSESFGYQEWEAPYLESLDLYAAKSGEELVNKQSYVFKDRGGDDITLRPELTPSLARMIAQRQGALVFPVRWWSFGPFWRYEKMQRGRSREFFQWNIDLLGADSPEADAEMIAIAIAFIRKVGLDSSQARVYVNNRKYMDGLFNALDIQVEERKQVSELVDRRRKMEPKEWEEYAKAAGLSNKQFDGLKAILDDTEGWRKSDDLVRLFRALKSYQVQDFVKFDPGTIRGLLYYTGTVFEAFDERGSVKRSILGGGRYDNLLADVGGEPVPAVGFAMGDVVISLILEELGLIPALPISPSTVLVSVFSPELLPDSIKVSLLLRSAGMNVTCYPEPAKLPRQFKFADRMGMKAVIVLGPDEAASGKVTIKNLIAGTQETVSQGFMVAKLREILEQQR